MASKIRWIKGTAWIQAALPFDVFLRVMGEFGGEIPTTLSELASKLDSAETEGKMTVLLGLILKPAELPFPLDRLNAARMKKWGVSRETLTKCMSEEQVGEVLAHFFIRYVKLVAKLGGTRVGSSIFPWKKKGPTLVDAFLMLTSFYTIWQAGGLTKQGISQDSPPQKA